MSGISKYTYATLTTAIRDYTEVDSNVFTQAIIDGFIMAAENRINLDCPSDSDRFVQEGTLAANVNNIRVPAGTLFVRGVEVFNSTSASTGPGQWLEKKDQTYLSEYIDRTTGPSGGVSGTAVTGLPKYYAMFGGATGLTDTTSGSIYLAPTPDVNYIFRIYYNKMPVGLGSGGDGNSDTYISSYFSQGLLYACLAEAFGFLKGPMDMLTLYEGKYNKEIQKFAGVQLGRRRRDDYTDGTVRIQVKSPSP
jgi:hypothetical protein|tara:strand:- start:205 stop:954 length:750 start_codon:yes stop_codon:yes gene_type:complete